MRIGAQRDGLDAEFFEWTTFRCDRSEFGGSNEGERCGEETDEPPLVVEI